MNSFKGLLHNTTHVYVVDLSSLKPDRIWIQANLTIFISDHVHTMVWYHTYVHSTIGGHITQNIEKKDLTLCEHVVPYQVDTLRRGDNLAQFPFSVSKDRDHAPAEDANHL